MLDLKKWMAKVSSFLTKAERRTLLWTNSAPSSNFAEQTISLALSNYDMIEVTYLSWAGFNYLNPVMLVPLSGSSDFAIMTSSSGTDGFYAGYPYFMARSFYATPTGVTFQNGTGGWHGGVWTTRNDCCIPWKIYGIKVGGG